MSVELLEVAAPAGSVGGVAAEVTCPLCGGPVTWQADGTSNGTRAVAMIRCVPCRSSFRLELTLTNVRVEGKSLSSLDALARAVTP